MADPQLQGNDAAHRVTRMWVVAGIRCGSCNLSWEQPMYADDEKVTWVCPRCLHGAPAVPVRREEGQG